MSLSPSDFFWGEEMKGWEGKGEGGVVLSRLKGGRGGRGECGGRARKWASGGRVATEVRRIFLL